jgi:2-polyprenyl-6-methoxyphenol hydroxylase-like FAD-dependent oxidoreductase
MYKDGVIECDVLVVGAGPTGLTLAAELQRRGVDCLLVDARAEPQHWDRATVVHPRTLEVFEALGFVDRVLAAGVPQRAARLYSAGKVLVELDFSLSGAPYPYNLGLSEEVTERFLSEYLEGAGGSVDRSTRLLSMTQDADGVTATVDRGGDEEEEVRAAWIVGCGGYHSPVRDEVGIALEGHDIADPWAVFDVTLDGRAEDFETTLVYLEDPMTILTPLPGRRFRVYTRPLGVDADFVADAAAVIAIYEPGQELVDVENPTRFACHAKVATRYREGRALLAGDPAHVCSPDQGHGMNVGIQDAVNLGWKLALVCEGDADTALLDSYEIERRPVALEVIAAGEAMEEMGRVDEAGRAARDAEVRAALTDPETAHAEAVVEAELNISYAGSPIVVCSGESGEDPSLTNSVEVRSGSSPDSLRAGDRLPDVGPVTARRGEPEVRLHELTQRPGHTLLVVAVGDGGGELAHLFAQLEGLVARSPLFDAAFALATAPDQAPVGTIHPDAARALGVKSLAVFAIRPDRHIGLIAEPATLDAVEAYEALVTG